jgi:ABC-type transport system involved in cytochrome bd biosynthesis fused ATPase/permease subunit
MELEEMKTLWEEMSVEVEKQKKLTDSLIIKMTRADYRNQLNKIMLPEAIGALVCFAGTVFILINLQKLNTWYLLACGVISALILVLLPVLSIKAIRKMRSVNISDNSYKQSLLEYTNGKIQFVFVQKLSFCLGAILMIVILPLMGQLIGGKDFFVTTRLWYLYAIAFPFFYWFAKSVFKSYNKTSANAENILKELAG